MKAIRELQAWYLFHCNGEWEHSYGVSISTLDNPGWSLSVDLIDTELENREFAEQSQGIDVNAAPENDNWISVKVENGQFKGFGGPEKLEELIDAFLSWAKRS